MASPKAVPALAADKENSPGPANTAAGPASLTPGKTGAEQKEECPQPQGTAALQPPAVLDNVGIKALLAAAKAAKVRPEAAFGAMPQRMASRCLSEGLDADGCAIESRTQIVTSQDKSWWHLLQVHEGLADAAAGLVVSNWQEREWHTALGALELCVALGVQGEWLLSAFYCSAILCFISSTDLCHPLVAGVTAAGRSRTGTSFATATLLLQKLQAGEGAGSSTSDDAACRHFQERLYSLFPRLPLAGVQMAN